MERIAKEGYNLNISRYISTATAQEEIELGADHQHLYGCENFLQFFLQ